MGSITINGVTLTAAELEVERVAVADASIGVVTDRTFVIVQWATALDVIDRARVDARFQLNEVVQGDACICKLRPSSSLGADVASLPVEVFPYSIRFKLNQAVFPKTLDPATKLSVSIVAHRGEDISALRSALSTHIPDLPMATLRESRFGFHGVIRADQLPFIAAVEGVRHVEPRPQWKKSSTVAVGVVSATQQVLSGVSGAGEIIAVCDLGFDLGSVSDVHPAFGNRVKSLYALTDRGSSDADGHGTAVASCALGNGVSTTMGPVMGMAPSAMLVVQCAMNTYGNIELDDDLGAVFKVPREKDGARIHNFSINDEDSQSAAAYTTASRSVDVFVSEHRDAVVCISIGNTGAAVLDEKGVATIAHGSICPPATSKNAIVVGASENDRPDQTGTYGPWAPDLLGVEPFKSDRFADSVEGLAAFSSRGPTRDQRFKPDVVAPGTCILAAASRAADGYAGSEVFGTSSDPLYCFNGGTSFSAPLVAGACALIREWLRGQRQVLEPSAALVKAVLINGATPMRGQYSPSEAGVAPNSDQGFGRVNVAASLGLDGSVIGFTDEARALATGDTVVETVSVSEGEELCVTLVWTDTEGEALCNDLDLIVRDRKGDERHGNMPAGSTDFDHVNNVEQVRWSDFSPGELEVIVKAHNVVIGPQHYALVWRKH